MLSLPTGILKHTRGQEQPVQPGDRGLHQQVPALSPWCFTL